MYSYEAITIVERAKFRRQILNEPVPFLIQHGYLLLFAWVLTEQMGLPVPAVPLLNAADG